MPSIPTIGSIPKQKDEDEGPPTDKEKKEAANITSQNFAALMKPDEPKKAEVTQPPSTTGTANASQAPTNTNTGFNTKPQTA